MHKAHPLADEKPREPQADLIGEVGLSTLIKATSGITRYLLSHRIVTFADYSPAHAETGVCE